MSERNLWTDKEMVLVLDLYFKLPFGRLNRTTPEVKALAALIGRTDNSVALRLVNYAACDPYIIESGRTGMQSGSKKCKPYWERFANNKEELFFLAEKYRAEYTKNPIEKHLNLLPMDFVGKEKEVVIKQRVNQYAFRSMVLNNYENRCAVSGITVPGLLVASHIIPWSVNENERLNPENGICLSPLYDKAFDLGYIGIQPNYKIVLSKELKEYKCEDFYKVYFQGVEYQTINQPIEHSPNTAFLEYHLTHIFSKHN